MDDLSRYVLTHYKHFLTPEEQEAVRVPRRFGGLLAALRADAPEGRQWGGLHQMVAERILREHAAEVFVNRCPRCDSLCRTPRAKQCFECGHAWHDPPPPQQPPVSLPESEPRPATPKPPPIAGLTAEASERVVAEMQDAGNLSLEEFVERQCVPIPEEDVKTAQPDYPHLSKREVALHLLFSGIADLEDGWLRRGISRRFSLGDPAGLARFLSMNARVKYLWYGGIVDNEEEYGNVFDALCGLAVRDTAVALEFANTGTFPIRRGHRETVLTYNGVYAVLRRERSYFRTFERSIAGRKVNRFHAGEFECLRGIMGADAKRVAKGLDQILRARNPWPFPLHKVVCLEAHGLYELARWVSPDLVSAFDPDRSLPWDRKLYEWATNNESPLRRLEVAGLPPVIRRAILKLDRPRWLVYDQPDD